MATMGKGPEYLIVMLDRREYQHIARITLLEGFCEQVHKQVDLFSYMSTQIKTALGTLLMSDSVRPMHIAA